MLLITILISVLVLSLVVIVHELGHFFACKLTATKVEEFGLGFPPRAVKLFKKGETLYSLNWIPFGGFNKILGEEQKNKDPRAFCNKNVWQRMFISVAGILANIIFAWFILTIWFWFLSSVTLPNNVAVVEVMAGSAAQEVGLKSGDLIIQAEEQVFQKIEDLTSFTQQHKGEEVNFVIKRNGKEFDQKIKLSDNTEAPLGVSLAETGGEFPKIVWWQVPLEALKEMGSIIVLTVVYVGKLIASLFGGEKVPFQLAGPVGIVAFSSQVISLGWIYILRLMAVLSLALALTNLLPIPAADGGHLVFRGLEVVWGKRVVKHEAEATIHYLGFILLLILLVLITYNDVVKFIVK